MSEPIAYDQANSLQKALRRYAATERGSWLFARVAPRIDRPLHRLTRGRHTFASLLSGLPVVMLTTVGAKSGRRHTVPLLGVPSPDGVGVIASNFGQARHPAWYHNLRAHPEAEVEIDRQRRRVRAVEADDERRAQIWDDCLRIYPGFGEYAKRASHRRISVFVLEPA